MLEKVLMNVPKEEYTLQTVKESSQFVSVCYIFAKLLPFAITFVPLAYFLDHLLLLFSNSHCRVTILVPHEGNKA